MVCELYLNEALKRYAHFKDRIHCIDVTAEKEMTENQFPEQRLTNPNNYTD